MPHLDTVARRMAPPLILLLLAACSGRQAPRQEAVPLQLSEPPVLEAPLETTREGDEGPLSQEELFVIVPSWQILLDEAQPDESAVRTLAGWQEEIEIQLVLGTWCGDSREHVPRLLKALSLADNPRVELLITALARGFRDRAGFADEYSITRVPTLIVQRGGVELGRYVETPVGDSIETDLVAILQASSE